MFNFNANGGMHIRRKYVVVDGRHRVAAATTLNLDSVYALVLKHETPKDELFKMAAGTVLIFKYQKSLTLISLQLQTKRERLLLRRP